MSTNTLNHISDESKYKTFDPTGTSFPVGVKDVQTALASLNPIAVNGVPVASESVAGITRFATQQEVNDGLDGSIAVSPKTLKERLGNPQASTTVIGLTRYATDAEAIAGAVTNAAIVPSSLKASLDSAFTTRTAKESVFGVIKIATKGMAEAGTDDTAAMTALKVQFAIAKAVQVLPVYGPATESVLGTVRIATNGQVAQGTLRDGYAVSPSGLASLTSTQARRGIVRAATNAETNTGTLTDVYVSPANLTQRVGTTAAKGLVKLTTAVGTGDANTALAYNADVVHTRGGQTIAGTTTMAAARVNGRIDLGSGFIGGQQIATVNMLVDSVPIGTIIMWGGVNPPSGDWMHCAGGWLGRNDPTYSRLYNTIGTNFGGDATRFRLPDFRGTFPRGAGKSEAQSAASQANTGKGQPGLGYNCGGASVGVTMPQAVRRHKHNSGWGEHHNRGDAYFGATVRNGFRGNNKRDSDNFLYFTNDGTEIEDNSIRDSFGTMNSDNLMQWENRPWSLAVNFVIKVK